MADDDDDDDDPIPNKLRQLYLCRIYAFMAFPLAVYSLGKH